MKTQKYLLEFTGTEIGKDKVPYTQTFSVVADSVDSGLSRLQRDNPKVTDFESTGKFTACNQDW